MGEVSDIDSMAVARPDGGTVRVPVELAGRGYDILIGAGLIGEAGRLVAERLPQVRFAIVTDTNVAGHHLAQLEAALGPANLRGSVVLAAGESTKSFMTLAGLSERLLELGVERGDVVVALGGGVIGDLAGFAASILRRGVRVVQIPTSLLAQVDSSVGGKTGINTPQGKNLIGTFYQPSLVLIDTAVLETLPRRQLQAGYAEVVKYGLLGDRPFFDWLEANASGLLAGDRSRQTHAIATSCRAKAAIVARDETETGERMLLNLGHTFGHALEAFCGYSDRLLHGEAVAIGMMLAFRFSEAKRLASAGTTERVERHLTAVGLPTRIADIGGKDRPDAATIRRLMGQDKKVKAGAPTLILVRDIGAAFATREFGWDDIEAFLGSQAMV